MFARMNSGLFALLTIVALQFLVINVRYVSSANYEVAAISTKGQYSDSQPLHSAQEKGRSVCEYCGDIPEKPMQCSECKMVSYCNTDCQEKDLELLHRKLCKHLKHSISSSPENRELLIAGYSRESSSQYLMQIPTALYSLMNDYAKNLIVGFKIEMSGPIELNQSEEESLLDFLGNKHSTYKFVSEPNVPRQPISLKASVMSLKDGDTKIILGVAFKKAAAFNFGDEFTIEIENARRKILSQALGFDLLERFLASFLTCVADSPRRNTNKVYEYSQTPQYQEALSYQYVYARWLTEAHTFELVFRKSFDKSRDIGELMESVAIGANFKWG
eukprot:772790_1